MTWEELERDAEEVAPFRIVATRWDHHEPLVPPWLLEGTESRGNGHGSVSEQLALPLRPLVPVARGPWWWHGLLRRLWWTS